MLSTLPTYGDTVMCFMTVDHKEDQHGMFNKLQHGTLYFVADMTYSMSWLLSRMKISIQRAFQQVLTQSMRQGPSIVVREQAFVGVRSSDKAC